MFIRRMEEKDRDAYLQMAWTFYHSPAVLHPVPDCYLTRAFDEVIRSDVYADGYLPISDMGEVMGYALLAKTFSQEVGGQAVWVEEIYIKPEFQGQGIGTRLLQFIEEAYPHCGRFRLEVEPDNEEAEKLYGRLGYHVLGYRQMVKDVPLEK
ncbi:MAG: N-acetyltransferase [Eubacteriales bacterium]|nr:N-acetyltransferase [Eubacteriales bacterium]